MGRALHQIKFRTKSSPPLIPDSRTVVLFLGMKPPQAITPSSLPKVTARSYHYQRAIKNVSSKLNGSGPAGWLPRSARFYEHTTTAPAPRLGLLQRLALAYCCYILCFAHARGRWSPRSCLDVDLPVSSLSGCSCNRGSFGSSPKFTGFSCHAPLPWSGTPVARASLAFCRDARTGPRWVNGEDSPQEELSRLNCHGFGARCQRFVPASRLTTHDSLAAVWLQTLPRGVLTRWAAL